MIVDTKNLISMTEANQNFSRVARLVDERGSTLILKNNVPRYLIMDLRRAEATRSGEALDVLHSHHRQRARLVRQSSNTLHLPYRRSRLWLGALSYGPATKGCFDRAAYLVLGCNDMHGCLMRLEVTICWISI